MTKRLKVLLASFEASPFIKTGGLGDVAGSLPAALRCPALEARCVLPKLGTLDEAYTSRMRFVTSFPVPLGWRNLYCGLFELRYGGAHWYFLDNEYYFRRERPYGYFDDGERMAFFSKAVCECLRYLPDFFPDVLHCNDWHTALAPVFLREQYRAAPGYENVRTVFTVHNLKFQGQFDPWMMGDVLGLAGCEAARNQLMRGGAVNFMAGALCYADRLTTVSPSYAEEICTGDLGEGLQDIFLRRRSVLSGILNGIDAKSYDPAADGSLAAVYTEPAGKAENKAALQKELGLAVAPDTPLCVVISRLTEQKGIDLLRDILWAFPQEGMQLAVLGTGERAYEDALRSAASAAPEWIAARLEFSEPLSRRLYAGGDMLLMPSRFEPCGLAQMIAMRYGTLPVVRQTGGLRDSVEPYNKFTGEGTGFGFLFYDSGDFLSAVRKGRELYARPEEWTAVAARCMARDFSWRSSAKRYRELYRGLCP